MAFNNGFTGRAFAKVKAVYDLVKPELPIAAGICVIVGQILALGQLPPFSLALLGFLTGFFVSGAAMISNDYFDLEVDRVNHPSRPLPSGRITVPELIALTLLFSIAGFVAAALMGPIMLALTIFIWIVSISYNWKFKESGLPGNMMVSLSVAWTFICGGLSVGGLASGVVWTFGALAFIFDLAEEISSGAMDVKGDELRNVRSVAKARGKRFAVSLSVALFALFIVISFIPYVLGWLGLIYLVLVVVADAVVVYLSYKLYRSQTPGEGRTALRNLYLTMVLFTVAFIASRFL